METDTIDGGTLEPDNADAQAAGSEELERQEPGEEPDPELSPELAHETERNPAPAGEVSDILPSAVEAEPENAPGEDVTRRGRCHT